MASINRPKVHRSRGLVLAGFLAIVSAFALFSFDNLSHSRGADASEIKKIKLSRSLMSLDQRQRREVYLASKLGLQYGVPKHALRSAVAKMHAMGPATTGHRGGANAAFGASSPAVASTWNLLGPQPMSEKANFTGTAIGSKVAMTGRITSVAADAHGVIVAGAASGGLWVSTDNGVSFKSVFDGQPTQAIGAIALDTTTLPNPTIYVGTGEGNGSIDSLYGAGIFKSADLGQTWTSLDPQGMFDRAAFTSLAIDTTTTPGNPRIFAGTTSGFSGNRADAGIFETDASKAGLWVTINGGMSWAQYGESVFGNCDLFGDINFPAPCPADDVKIDPTNPMNVYVAIDGNGSTQAGGIFYSHDGGANFLKANFPLLSFLQGRRSLAVGPVVPAPIGPASPSGGVVYTMVGGPLGDIYNDLLVSFDGGVTWNPNTISPPNVPFFSFNNVTIDGANPNNFSQSFYDQAMLVSPTDPATVYFGGVGLYKSSGDFGNSWAFLAPNGGIHPDIHALVLSPFDHRILVATDGGLFRFDPAQQTPTFTSFNFNINAAQVQGIGPHPTDPTKLIAGFQSNGTQLFSNLQANWAAPDTETGDGGFAFYDIKDPTFLYHTFSLDELNHAVISASSDGGVTWCSAPNASIPACNVDPVLNPQWTPALQAVIDSVGNDPGPGFYPAIAVDPTTPHRVFFGAHSIYVSTDGMAHWAQQTATDLTSPGVLNGAPEGDECVDQSCSIEDIEFGPVDGFHGHPAWALAMSDLNGAVEFELSNTTQADRQIVDPTNANDHGAFWTDLTNAVDTILAKTSPDFGALATQATSIAPDPTNSNVAYLGLSGFTADTGVGHIYKTINFGTSWTLADGNSLPKGATVITPLPTGLPDVPVLKIIVDSTDQSGLCAGNPCSNSIYAGTDIGVFHSADGGATWQPFNDGLPAVPIYDLAQNTVGTLFAGTHGRGVYGLGITAVTPTMTPTAAITQTPTPTPTTTPTATATNAGTPTATTTPTTTRTATSTPTTTVTPTRTPTPTRTATPTPTLTVTPTTTPTATPTATATPNGAILTAPSSLALPSAGIGAAIKPTKKTFVIKNSGKKGAGLLTGTVTSSNPDVFSISPGVSFSLAAGKSVTESVFFKPSGTTNTASAMISTVTAGSKSVALSGTGLPGVLSAPKSLKISGKVGVPVSGKLTFKNSGKGVLSGSWGATTGPYTDTPASFPPLLPGKTATITVGFTAAIKGNAVPGSVTITTTSVGGGGPVTVPIQGVGK